MKKTNILSIILIGLITVISSCTKNYSSLNTNPNTSEKALPEHLLARALVSVVSSNMNRSQTITNELMQVTVNTLIENDRIFRYDIKRSISDAPWNNWYIELTNFKDIYKYAEETNNSYTPTYKAISLICQSWIYSMLTDTYGDIPYSESNKAKEGVYMPAFDRQKDVYLDIFKKLEEANVLLKGNVNVLSNSDPIFGGKALSWRKFSNSLYLRLLLRVSKKGDVATESIAKIKEIAETNASNYPVINSNAESAILRWTGAAPLISPFADTKQAEWRYPRSCSFFVNSLDATNDPCIGKWVSLNNGLYEGISSGYVFGQTPEPKSYMPYTLMTDPVMGNILNFAEVQFILAEASLNGWITATPQTFYDKGIVARINHWDRTEGTYLNGAKVKWDNAASYDAKMERILYQKYLALFYTDMQSWFEYRRTGHPILPKNAGLQNNGIMPARLNYPLNVQSTNSVNYNNVIALQGPDELSTQVWWQKP